MSDVMNSIFGRSKNDIPDSRETVDTEAIEVDQTATVEPAGGATEAVSEDESVETSPETAPAAEAADSDQAEEDPVNTADALEVDTAEADETDDEIGEGDQAVVEITAEDSGEAVADTDSAEAESDAVESDDAPVAVVAEADENEAVQAEPVIEPVEPVVEPVATETRPAAGVRGSITMGDGVVVKIVTMVAAKVEGVHALGDEGVSVMVDGEVATIEISLVIEFGHRLKALAEQIRIKVIEAVEDFLGLDVEVVDIHVLDIHLPEAD